MIRIESWEDERRGVVTYDLGNGQCICSDKRALDDLGIYEILRRYNLAHHMPTERREVWQDGRKIGTLPPDFDPYRAKTRSPLYHVRQGDFVFDGEKWRANPMLGAGDLAAIPGFQACDGFPTVDIDAENRAILVGITGNSPT
jgi:hypothetical protein